MSSVNDNLQLDDFDSFDDFDGFEEDEEIVGDSPDVTVDTTTDEDDVLMASLDELDEMNGFDTFDEDDSTYSDTDTSVEITDTSSEAEPNGSVFSDYDEQEESNYHLSMLGGWARERAEEEDLLATMNKEDSWVTDVELSEDAALNEEIVADAMADTVNKNSFDGLFLDSTSAMPASTGVHTSVLENGACTGNAFSLQYINIADIIVWTPRVRGNTDISALVTSIKNDGLLLPLVVAPTKTEGRYVLIKGSRRLLACATLGMKKIPCVINNQISNSDIHVVEPIYSHNRPYSVTEMLNYIDYIKKERGIDNPSMIEYLLNMESGCYMKLMDVMDDNDDEIVSALLTGEIDIKTAYKKLEQKRKKAGRDKMADMRANKIYGDASYGTDITANSGETNAEGEQLTDDEIRDIVDGVGDLENVGDLDGEELRTSGDNIQGFAAHRQDPNERERLDPKLRKAVLARDDNTCRVCGMGGQEYPEVLDVHHVIEVYLGGNDDINNLLCACTVCHKLIHLWGRGELQVRPFDQMGEAEANKFKRIIKLGNVIRQGMAAKGMKKEQLKKLDQADTIGRRLKGSSDQVAG